MTQAEVGSTVDDVPGCRRDSTQFADALEDHAWRQAILISRSLVWVLLRPEAR
jgi:hypothetical protein